jgi:DNA-binding transcriptional ArsR family regulator
MNETASKTRAILHPVRARIIVALNDRPLTPRRIAALMEEVPLGTVYRHLNILLEAGLIKVVGERRVKGTLERQFAVVDSASFLTEKERESLTADDITGLVAALSGVIQAGFHRYTERVQLPPKEGEISLIAKSLYLTREEYDAFRRTLITLLGKVGRGPGPEYERRMIGFFSVPDPELATLDEPDE